MSLARIRKAPSRLLERVSNWRRTRSRSRSSSSNGRCSRGQAASASASDHVEDDESACGHQDEPLLTEKDHKELMNLLSQNISMDFILEMKEAFQLFDKVRQGQGQGHLTFVSHYAISQFTRGRAGEQIKGQLQDLVEVICV